VPLKVRCRHECLFAGFDCRQAHQNEVTAVVFSVDGAWLYSTSKDKSIIVWDAKRMWAVRHTYRDAHDDWINTIAISPNGRYVVTGLSTLVCGVVSSVARFKRLQG
jgi:WD40 repeat protein